MSNAVFSKVRSSQKWKKVPPVRLELTTFRLWDWRAADCAKEAAVGNGHNVKQSIRLKRAWFIWAVHKQKIVYVHNTYIVVGNMGYAHTKLVESIDLEIFSRLHSNFTGHLTSCTGSNAHETCLQRWRCGRVSQESLELSRCDEKPSVTNSHCMKVWTRPSINSPSSGFH